MFWWAALPRQFRTSRCPEHALNKWQKVDLGPQWTGRVGRQSCTESLISEGSSAHPLSSRQQDLFGILMAYSMYNPVSILECTSQFLFLTSIQNAPCHRLPRLACWVALLCATETASVEVRQMVSLDSISQVLRTEGVPSSCTAFCTLGSGRVKHATLSTSTLQEDRQIA